MDLPFKILEEDTLLYITENDEPLVYFEKDYMNHQMLEIIIDKLNSYYFNEVNFKNELYNIINMKIDFINRKENVSIFPRESIVVLNELKEWMEE